MRGEVTKEEDRNKDRATLMALRNLDFEFLELSISIIISKENAISAGTLRKAIERNNNLSEKRDSLIRLYRKYSDFV